MKRRAEAAYGSSPPRRARQMHDAYSESTSAASSSRSRPSTSPPTRSVPAVPSSWTGRAQAKAAAKASTKAKPKAKPKGRPKGVPKGRARPAVKAMAKRRGRPRLSGDPVPAPSAAGAWPRCHEVYDPTCARCIFGRRKGTWQKIHGSFTRRTASGCLVQACWLQERPARLGQRWGIGCGVCAHLVQRASSLRDNGIGHLRRRWTTKWARFEISSVHCMQASCLQLHAQSAIHLTALKAMQLPDVSLSQLVCHDPSDTSLLVGAVPQLHDWVRAWRTVRSPISFLKHEKTEAYVTCKRGDARHLTRTAIKDMVEIMVEVVRETKRRILATADHASISLDDEAPYRVVRYRCARQKIDTDAADSMAAPWLADGDGVLSVLRNAGQAPSTEALDEDYSKKICLSIQTALQRLATPMGKGQQPDVDVMQRFKEVLSSYSSDGGRPMRKCGKLLQQGYPRLVLCLLDKAHNVRRASLPITMEENFKSWWHAVWGSKHSLIPDLQNSSEWRMRFHVLQQAVLKASGNMAGQAQGASEHNNLAAAIKTLSFAKQRFDSFSSPQGKFIALLLPVALLLAAQSMDHRLDGRVRHRCREMLERLTGENILLAGLAADFGAEVLRFVRHFDVRDPDIAATLRLRDDFVCRLRRLFSEGRILLEPEPDGSILPETFTHMGVRTAMAAAPIQYGDRMHCLWGPTDKAKCKEIMSGLHVVVDAVISRCYSDMSEPDLHMAFALFDLPLWQQFKVQADDDPGTWGDNVASMKRRAARLARALGLDSHVLWQETSAAVHAFLEDEAAVSNACEKQDSRPCWRRVLRGEQLPGCQSRFQVLQEAVAFYVSVQDGECSVERDLAQLRELLKHHEASLDERGVCAAMLLELRLDGPRQESDLALRLSGEEVAQDAEAALLDPFALADKAVLKMTSFTRRCAQLWIQHHGRRFRCYKERADKGQTRVKRQGTMASVFRGQVKASNALASMQRPPAGNSATVVPGMRLSSFAQRSSERLRQNGRWNAELEKFQKLTESKNAERAQERARQLARQPPLMPPLRVGRVFKKGPCIQLQRQTVVADLSTECNAAEAFPGCRYKRCQGNISYEDFQRTSILAVDDAVAVEQGRAGRTDAIIRDCLLSSKLTWLLGLVALGKGIASIAHWKTRNRCRHIRDYDAAHKLVPAGIFLSAEFRHGHGAVARWLARIVALPESRWRICDMEAEADWLVTDSLSLCKFLAAVRRLARHDSELTCEGSNWKLGPTGQLPNKPGAKRRAAPVFEGDAAEAESD
ncbi:unnamed protein product [Symbiodinium natans]|uniref:Uncharacterized protein n=1 Tax=Symbiodinium natans TaxID=878477 RepID=A0A812H3N6_9DINO|nr:unnamed protein product [Symbiodinium natans]